MTPAATEKERKRLVPITQFDNHQNMMLIKQNRMPFTGEFFCSKNFLLEKN
jgi:hypothetical protein